MMLKERTTVGDFIELLETVGRDKPLLFVMETENMDNSGYDLEEYSLNYSALRVSEDKVEIIVTDMPD